MAKIIEVSKLYFTYLPGTPYEKAALQNIDFSLDKGETLVILGPNGSGKSTLAQHFNGLLYPTSGTVTVCDMDTSSQKSRQRLWEKVSLVFQYPEQQIFQLTVHDEVAYGLRNLKISEAEVRPRVCSALEQVGLDPDDMLKLAPHSLSGGMRRRVAIASMLALDPEILVMDEPMAGLDPWGQKLIIDIVDRRKYRQETTVLISHNLKSIMALADKILILDQGQQVFFGGVEELMQDQSLLKHYHLQLPDYLEVVCALAERGFEVQPFISSIAEAGREILNHLPIPRS